MIRRFLGRRFLMLVAVVIAATTPIAMLEDDLPAFASDGIASITSFFKGSPSENADQNLQKMDVGGIGANERRFGVERLLNVSRKLKAEVKEEAIAADVEPEPYLEGPVNTKSLTEVLRFDITPTWVTQNWSRVSTITSDFDLMGMRVPLVTGTAENDMAGSLTIYFDRFHQVQRINYEGFTGDPRKLIALGTQHLGLTHEPSLGAGMFVTRWNGVPTSVLRVDYVPVVRSSKPNARCEFLLEINRPNLAYGVSEDVRTMLEKDQHINRWIHRRPNRIR